MINKKPLKGMQDIVPKEAEIRRDVQNIIVDTFIKNGFLEIATPSLDSLDLLASSQGGDNEKIMFNVLKRGDKLDIENAKNIKDLCDMGLRFDLTMPLSRFYANNMNELPNPFKVFQIGHVWRGERPQRGRFRQFTQCDIDIIGDNSIVAEISLIKTVADALANVGFNDIEIMINNRQLINELLTKYELNNVSDDVMIILDKLDKISFEKALDEVKSKNIDSSKFESLYNEIKALENCEIDSIEFNSEVVSDFKTLVKTLKGSGYNVVYEPTLIRGMGYYTGTIFEVKDTNLNSSIAGGGRYDKLIGLISGIDVPACGFSIGFERIALLLLEKGSNITVKEKCAVIYDSKNMENIDKVLKYIEEEQNNNKIVSLIAMKKNLKKQISDLQELGYSDIKTSKDF